MIFHLERWDLITHNLFASFIEPLCLGGALGGFAFWRIAIGTAAVPSQSGGAAVSS
jgi:hypothetical protein